LDTSRLQENFHGPWKMKGHGDQYNGVLVVRVKSTLTTALREIKQAMGKTCVFPDPDWSKLPAFKPQKISVVPVRTASTCAPTAPRTTSGRSWA
jgi:hypothetical protein